MSDLCVGGNEGRRHVVELQCVAVTVAAVVALLLTTRNGKGRIGTGVCG